MKRYAMKARLAWLVAIAMCAALVPQKARALDGKQVVSGGGEIKYTGATSVSWVDNTDGSRDFLITYADPTTPGSFTFPGMTMARILAVGGGGGGAGMYSKGTKSPYGGAGGGGGGGFVETNDMFAAGSFDVTVGAGGAGGLRNTSSSADFTGETGQTTLILRDEEEPAWLSALGGGGGGGNCAGKDGANGGGGSQTKAGGGTAGGQSLPGSNGYAGGAGNLALYGGGGGGAGAAGAAANATGGGKGGDGKSSDITGAEVWYAGGGGGGYADKAVTTGSSIVGGKGGGGAGGYGGATTATAGTNGLGGGGGGADGDSCNGGNGGSGVVIVRISGAISGGLTKPTDMRVKYDGKEHISYQTSPFYTVTGQNVGTNIGVYAVTVTPKAGIKWTDESDDPVSVTMTIYDGASQSGTAIVTGSPIQYFGVAETNWVDGDLLLKFTGAGTFTLPGTTKARILAVGGGGGGAGMYSKGTKSPYGGAGGGGAGGFVEKEALFSSATYYVGVGSGGAGGLRNTSSGADFTGQSGQDTVILTNSLPWVNAVGGGGGGGNCDGKAGGSGGGGSQSKAGVGTQGGTATDGQGNVGGAGNTALYGGGGGGAGQAGASASAGGKGGDGKASNITGTEVWYAGGGGGGYADKTIITGSSIAGGKGGGGAGGYGGATTATAGTDGLGGGGGGADGNSCNGAKGGSGIVYVRISAAMVGELTKPEKVQDYVYDGNAHTSVVKSAFYEVSGENVGTDVGEYNATVTLVPGFSWPGGDTESPVNVKMTISKVQVVLSGLSMADWEYTVYSAERSEPTCTVSPDWVKPVFEYATAKDAPEEDWTTTKPSDAGAYWVRARVPDTKNYEGETQYASFTILRRNVTFTGLFQKDWMEGTPDDETPRPRCTVDPSWVTPRYQYAESEDSAEWSDTKPTTLGSWAIRVIAMNDKNYVYTPITASFKIVKGRGGTFVDYVEIEISGYTGSSPSVLSNFPYRIALSEDALPGFLYERAGKDGNELGLTDEKGNDLMYRVDDWNVYGESAIWVRVPEIGPEKQIIRLYWKLREGATAPEHYPESVFEKWTKKQAEEKADKLSHVFDLVVKNGYRVNYWTRNPRLTRTVWPQGGVAGTLVAGKLAEGTYSQRVVNAVSGEEVSFPPTKGGAYRYIFTLDDPNMEYEPLEFHIDFAITTSTSMDDLQGDAPNLTVNGRVMLANDDVAIGHEVSGQSYWRTDPETQPIFWQHSGEHTAPSGTMPNLYRFPGSVHRLNYLDEESRTNVLWRMQDVILGNTFNGTTLASARCYLPWSPTGLGISSESAAQGACEETGNMVLRNSLNAHIYSPCYTNGIGTIYFDAVNAFYIESTGYPEQYQIAVDWATNVLDEAGHSLPPTDANCHGKNISGNDEEFVRLTEDRWHPATLIALKRDKNADNFTRLDPAQTVPIAITTGGSTNNFYRICVNLDYHGPVRFRIRRASLVVPGTIDVNKSLIAIDNILVSYPKTTANLRPLGTFKAEKGGKQVMGQEGAFSVPFPAVSDTEVYGGATNDIYMSDICKADPKSLVLLSRMYYRWRYGNQASNVWRSVDLSPFDNFRATTPLKLENDEGDMEFWYESFMNIPYYKYYDYSGAGVGLGGLYTEETGTVTNRLDKTGYSTFSGPGDDWFVRFRAGKSGWDEINVLTTGAYTNNVPMELIGDHTWRGLVKVPLKAEGPVSFKFLGGRRRSAWGALEESDIWWYPTADVEKMPFRGGTSTASGYKDKHGYPADTASNYIEFQFNDETGAFTVGHAEYQTFNAWHDAHREDGKFVGNYAETSGVSVAEMVQTNAHMKTWTLLKTTDDNWNETFVMKDYLDPGYPKYTSSYLLSHKMPHQWNGENGIFVDATITASNKTAKTEKSGIAWQMRGKGIGNMSFTQSDTPSGLDTVTFKARLAQGLSFNDYSVWDGDGSSTAKNYTFVCPALLSLQNGNDCSPGASMSVVGCYRDRRGCYEFRIERTDSEGLLFSIYKWWAIEGDEILPELLGSQWFKGTAFMQNTTTKPNFYAMFISVGEETSGKTTIIAGLSTSAGRPDQLFTTAGSTTTKYKMLCCIDDSKTRFTTGGFGVLSANCNGYFMDPRYYKAYLEQSSIPWKAAVNPATSMYKGYADSQPVTYPAESLKVDFRDTIKPENAAWGYTPGRAEYCTIFYENQYSARGIRAPAGLNQTVGLYLKPATGGSWSLYDSKTVNAYGFADFSVVVRTNENCHVMLKTGTKTTDVTLWETKQTGWSGENIANMTSLARDFIYTQAYVYDEISSGSGTAKVTNRYCRLQPARVKSDKPLSIRSPLLKGLGMVGFSYKDVKPGAEVWVQIATNNVSARLSGTGGYNESVESMEPGGDEPVGTWVTLKKYSTDDLKAASGQTYYIGLHDRLDVPLEGAIRIFVPTNVCNEAVADAKKNPEYGSITITDIYVHDEPALDTKSWIGWNLRTIGDPADTEKRMYLPDLTASTSGDERGCGLSAGLNNSYKNDIVGDSSLYDKMDPTIQSPTFGRYTTATGSGQAKIGQVRFRARLYGDGSTSAKVTLYGCSNSAETDWGEPLTNFTVTASRYRIFEYKAPSGKNFAAVRLAVNGVTRNLFGLQRVLLDEVVVSEKNDTAVGFQYLRPFRSGLETDIVVADILAKEQQPLCDESWGVQTQLKFDKFGNDVDFDRGFRVTFRYFVGAEPWGFENWSKLGGVPEVELTQVGAKSDYIFRSTASDRDTIVPPEADGTVVQYAVTVYFYEKGNDMEYERTIAVSELEGDGWTNPTWYWPVDKNRTDTGDWKSSTSPYTLLEAISPGRAWINEVSYNDGPKQQEGNGGIKIVTNQFLEVAVPWGVDLTGWKLVLTDYDCKSTTLAVLGKNGIPGKKQTDDGHRSGDYDFLVLESPATRNAGGVRDPLTGEKAADGTWSGATLSGSFSGGTLQYDMPYQLELIRPSGIVEHQYVIAGTNEYAYPNEYYELFGYQYDGTNLVNELNLLNPSVKRYYAGKEEARRASYPDRLASFGVVGKAHGEDGGWSPDMGFTPGRVNEGQDELSGWYIHPSGGSCWVYMRIDKGSPHLTQRIGDDTSSDTFALVNSGHSTNIVYTAAPWYQLDRVLRIENGVTNVIPLAKKGTYDFTVSTVTGLTTIVACEAISSDLIDGGLDPLDRYTPAIMRWLEGGVADGKPFKNPSGPIRFATYRGLDEGATNCVIGLKGMYWFDIDPTEGGWWLRGQNMKITSPVPRIWYTSTSETPYDNVQLKVKLYLSNDTDRAEAEVFAPKRLQGVGGERSDEVGSYANWTSETFKVEGILFNGEKHNVGYLPFRWFVFGSGSFTPKGGADEFTAQIEMVDPFSTASPGYTYGWSEYKGCGTGFRWNIDEKLMPVGVEMLKADSTYEGKRPFIPVK